MRAARPRPARSRPGCGARPGRRLARTDGRARRPVAPVARRGRRGPVDLLSGHADTAYSPARSEPNNRRLGTGGARGGGRPDRPRRLRAGPRLAALRRAAPRTSRCTGTTEPRPNHGFWSLTRHADVVRVIRDAEPPSPPRSAGPTSRSSTRSSSRPASRCSRPTATGTGRCAGCCRTSSPPQRARRLRGLPARADPRHRRRRARQAGVRLRRGGQRRLPDQGAGPAARRARPTHRPAHRLGQPDDRQQRPRLRRRAGRLGRRASSTGCCRSAPRPRSRSSSTAWSSRAQRRGGDGTDLVSRLVNQVPEDGVPLSTSATSATTSCCWSSPATRPPGTRSAHTIEGAARPPRPAGAAAGRPGADRAGRRGVPALGVAGLPLPAHRDPRRRAARADGSGRATRSSSGSPRPTATSGCSTTRTASTCCAAASTTSPSARAGRTSAWATSSRGWS